jgi:hypothetical protein
MLVGHMAFSTFLRSPEVTTAVPKISTCNIQHIDLPSCPELLHFSSQLKKRLRFSTNKLSEPSMNFLSLFQWKVEDLPWNDQAIQFVQDLGKRISEVTNEPLEAQYRFQRLSMV